MNIEEVELPILANYYFSERIIESIINMIKFPKKVEIENNHLHLYIEDNPELDDCLILIKKKSEKITNGDKYIFEYELDISIPNGNVFLFKINGKIYKCLLFSGSHSENGDIHIIFNILN